MPIKFAHPCERCTESFVGGAGQRFCLPCAKARNADLKNFLYAVDRLALYAEREAIADAL